MTTKKLDFNNITQQLMVGVTPRASHFDQLKDLGIELIINMRAERFALPIRPRNSIKTLWVPSFDTPLLPIKARFIFRAVEQAVDTIKQGGKVYVYCKAGKHRSVLMAAAILIAQGSTAKAATELLKTKRIVADPNMPHIYKEIVGFADFLKQQK